MQATLAQLLDYLPSTARHDAICWPDASFTWPQLAHAYREASVRLAPWAGSRVGLSFSARPENLATLVALERLSCDVFLMDAQLPTAQHWQWAEALQLAAVIAGHGDISTTANTAMSAPPNEKQSLASRDADLGTSGSVTILTSGTTGTPKAVRHSWLGLARPVRATSSTPPQRWLLAYRPQLYAGLQVILQSLLNLGTLVAAEPQATPAATVDWMAAAQVEFASATPSYWRRLLIFGDREVLQKIPLRQITLGGEAIDQPLLDQLHATFPAARIVHIYATTELGRCFAVSDGLAGFPQSMLDLPTEDGVELRVIDNQLYVRSANAMVGYDRTRQDPTVPGDSVGLSPSETAPSGTATSRPTADAADQPVFPQPDPSAASVDQSWLATGDLVTLHDGRVYFAGRASEIINVGGNKVAPLSVERVIREVEGVADVRVYAQSSSIAGQLVACQLVPRPGIDPERLQQQVRAQCASRLARWQCPRLIEVVDQLLLNSAGKLSR